MKQIGNYIELPVMGYSEFSDNVQDQHARSISCKNVTDFVLVEPKHAQGFIADILSNGHSACICSISESHCSEQQANTSCRASVANVICTDIKRRSDRHHLLNAVLEKEPAWDSRRSMSSCASLSVDMEAPANHSPPCLSLSAA